MLPGAHPRLRLQILHVYGYRSSLRLDSRFRFRLPDDVTAHLRTEYGRVSADSPMPPGALNRLSFYLVPGPQARILLYPGLNIRLAIRRFENTPAGADPDQTRLARDYFYNMMRFVETDAQSRVLLPEHLRRHAGIEGTAEDVVLAGHDLWLTLMRASVASQEDLRGREALDALGAAVLDPVWPTQQPTEPEIE